jgi:hypothetical protein
VETFQDFFLQHGFSKDLVSFQIQKSCHLTSKDFLQGLAEICSTGSCDEKCLISRLVSATILHLQSTQQNKAYHFLESTPAVHLSAKTPC